MEKNIRISLLFFLPFLIYFSGQAQNYFKVEAGPLITLMSFSSDDRQLLDIKPVGDLNIGAGFGIGSRKLDVELMGRLAGWSYVATNSSFRDVIVYQLASLSLTTLIKNELYIPLIRSKFQLNYGVGVWYGTQVGIINYGFVNPYIELTNQRNGAGISAKAGVLKRFGDTRSAIGLDVIYTQGLRTMSNTTVRLHVPDEVITASVRNKGSCLLFNISYRYYFLSTPSSCPPPPVRTPRYRHEN